MGIRKNFEGDANDTEPVNYVPNVDLTADTNLFNDSSSSGDDEVVQGNSSETITSMAEPVSPPSNRKPKVKIQKMPKPMLHVRSLGGKKSQGNRQVRRHENMCFLLNLARDLDEDFAEVNINDLVETTISAFAQLLLSKNKMKIWNEFTELPESQQERLMNMARKNKKNNYERANSQERSTRDTTPNSRNSEENIDTFVFIEHLTTTNDTESVHPLRQKEEADACFRRIDPHIRYTLKSMLKRHHLPLEQIAWFENDIMPFFTEHPDSVYLRHLNHGLDRMLLHAVCQYLTLISKSSTRDGERYTQVENRRVQFLPPMILLSNYLKRLEEMIHNDS